MLPVILQETEEPVTEGYAYVHPFYCGISRNMIDVAAKGHLDFFDALLYSDICIQNRNVACSLRQMMPPGRVELIQFPTRLNQAGALEDTIAELERIKGSLQDLCGSKIDDQALSRSIGVFNRHRSLLGRFHEACNAEPQLLPFRDRQVVTRSGMLMPKEVHSELLEGLLTTLEAATPRAAEGVPVFLSGHLCQGPKPDILDLIESLGGVIVDDDLYTGYRYFAVNVDTDVDPIEGLAKRYLDRSLPIPTRSDQTISWDRYVVDKARESRARGVIILIAKYCEPHLFLFPFIKEALTKAGIPFLMLETEHEVVSLEGMKTRLQAFIEMLSN
jgi:bcr-type benzoyl-CoA reductase subunit C